MMRILSQLLGAPPYNQILREEPGEGGSTPPPDPAPATPPADPAPAADYSWMPETFRPEGADPDFQGFRTAYDDAQAQLAALSDGLPEDASGYTIAPPAEMDYGDITPPEWFQFNLDAENPMVGELQGWMHENRVPPASAEGLVGLFAKYEASRAAQFQADAAAEMQALGPQGQARIDRITRSVETRIPDQAQREALIGSLTTAAAVRAVETLLSGATQPRSTTPTPPGQDIEKLTPLEKHRLANQQAAAS